MVDPGIFGFSEIVENNLPYSITGWAQSWCSGQFDYIPPAGWRRSDCYCCDPVGSHNGCSYCAMSKVTCVPIENPNMETPPVLPPDAEPIIPEEHPPTPRDEYDTHGCNTTIGQTWCDNQQICLIETESPCNPIIPVDQVPEPEPINEPVGQEPIYMEPIIPQPECEPIADKPWSCGGVNEVDRYDCIDGKITLTEKDSTACGYQAPQEPVQEQTGMNLTPLLAVFGIAALGGVILFMSKGDKK